MNQRERVCQGCHGSGTNWDCGGENDRRDCECENCTGNLGCPECGVGPDDDDY